MFAPWMAPIRCSMRRSATLPIDSSPLSGMSQARASAAMPSKSSPGSGCSMNIRFASRARCANSRASAKVMPVLASAHSATSGPRQRRTSTAASASSRGCLMPIFSLKKRQPAASSRRASAISSSTFGLPSRYIGSRSSRSAPPNRSARDTPRCRPTRSASAMSTAHLAPVLPTSARAQRRASAARCSASCPASSGAR